jgi:23S rRNA (cytidine1920-2'-O)/16S rRNA (cytidine1409-2'-O)-methyltransferase
MAETRLDVALSERGLARSRTHAAKLVGAGLVSVNGRPVMRASALVTEGDAISVDESDHYVSRAAHKLIAALDAFEIDVEGAIALDAGASTGGFSQVLLERGASLVLAIDVGHGQLAREVAASDRLRSREGVNARSLSRDVLAELFGAGIVPRLVVADLSFISLQQVLPALVVTASEGADFVLLVKPQFEVGRSGIREGIVRDAALRADAVTGVLWAAHDLGLGTAGVVPSPIAGSKGNSEYLVWLSARSGSNPTEWVEKVTAMVGA